MATDAARGLFEARHFEIEFSGDGDTQRLSLADCWDRRFEEAEPVRGFRWSRGQEHFPGWWWSVTTGRHVGFESWLERDHAMLMDFDPKVVGFASQPFWLHWHDGRRRRRHAPDFFARLDDGAAVVVDVRADDRVGADAEVFAVTEAACQAVGWRFRRVGLPEPVLVQNVRWLSRYRHPRCCRDDIAVTLTALLAEPRCLREAAAEVGDVLAVLPVVFHLIWHGVLLADVVSELLNSETVVVSCEGLR